MPNDRIIDDTSKMVLFETFHKSRLNVVDVIAKDRSEIISKMTRALEQRLADHLMEISRSLLELPLTENVSTSLLEVNALINRLKQAACYPNNLPEDDGKKEDIISTMLERYFIIISLLAVLRQA
jgi:hypothetical protein